SSFFKAIRVAAAQDPQVHPVTANVVVFEAPQRGQASARARARKRSFFMKSLPLLEQRARDVRERCGERHDHGDDPENSFLAAEIRWTPTRRSGLAPLDGPPVGPVEGPAE